MSEPASKYLTMIPYPIREITVSPTYHDLYWWLNPEVVDICEDCFRDDPDRFSGIDLSADGFLLWGLEALEGARRAGLVKVRVTLHDDTTATLLGREVRMIDLAMGPEWSTPMTSVRCLVQYDQLLRDPACPRIPDVPQADPAEMIDWLLDCSLEDARQYLQVLRAPRAVQDALDQEKIDLEFAAQVYTLPQYVQDEIAGMILPLLPLSDVKNAQARMINQYVQFQLGSNKPGREHLSETSDERTMASSTR